MNIIDIYRSAFNQYNLTFRIWEDSTFYLYIAIIAIVAILGFIAEHKKSLTPHAGLLPFVIANIFMFLIMGCRGAFVGADTPSYLNHFVNTQNITLLNNATIEPGFQILAYVSSLLFSNGHMSIILLSALMIFMVSTTIWNNRSIINVGFSLLIFSSVYYLQSLNLMRMYFAATIVFWASKYFFENRIKRFAVYIAIAVSLHFSSIVVMIPFGTYYLYNKNKNYAYAFIVAIIIATIGASATIGSYVSSYERYAGHIDSNSSSGSLGIMLLLDYLPCLLIFLLRSKYKIDSKETTLFVCYTISAYSIRLSAYFITMAGRLSAHMLLLSCFLLPFMLNKVKQECPQYSNMLNVVTIMWVCLKIHLYMRGYLSIDAIMPYDFFWNE